MKTFTYNHSYLKYILVILAILFSLHPMEAASGKKPNILIIMADDCTFSDLSLYGGTNVKTPNIEQLAEEGMLFSKAYVTMSMCVPCRAELYTGLYPVRNGAAWNHSQARNGTHSIVQYLQEYGYRTGIAGKVHANPRSVYPFEMVEGVERNCVSETADYDNTNMTEFINRSDDPFCLVTALVVPHIPWTVGDPSHFDPKKLNLPPYLADTKETRENFARYLAEIEVLDQQVGATLKMLDKSGKADNTLVLFTSEQGGQWPFCKWTNWDQGVHTSCIVRWPGMVDRGVRTEAIIQYADILPTLYEAVSGNKLKHVDGKSFLSVLKGKSETHKKFAYFMHNNIPEGPSYPIRSVTNGKYHYIRNLNHEALYIERHLKGRMPLNKYWPSWMYSAADDDGILDLVTRYLKRPYEQLYDVEADPYELNNLAGNPEYSTICKFLSDGLDEWMTEQGDPGALVDTWKVYREMKKGNHFSPLQ